MCSLVTAQWLLLLHCQTEGLRAQLAQVHRSCSETLARILTHFTHTRTLSFNSMCFTSMHQQVQITKAISAIPLSLALIQFSLSYNHILCFFLNFSHSLYLSPSHPLSSLSYTLFFLFSLSPPSLPLRQTQRGWHA